ncbi:MAG: SIS domain-containing protein [Oscillospiraceae bacterium]|nr:SIS domain-containing protein [Oscillospiraceae bacterium]
MIFEEYLGEITSVLNNIKETQKDKILSAAEMVAETIKNDGIIYIFGCGHSHLIALDCFYRAGGLANVSAMLDTDLMLHNGAAKSSKLEKMSGIAESVFERYCLTDKDILITVSTSGKNAVPVEMAKVATECGIRNIAVASSAYFADKKDADMLYECADMYIDNCVPHGDAVMDILGCGTKMGSVSTAASSYILNSVLLEAAELAAKDGAEIPIYMSGNVDGGAEYNKALIKKYLPRIKHL